DVCMSRPDLRRPSRHDSWWDWIGDPIFSEDDMPTHDEIFQKVQATLVDALGVDEEDVTRDATLQGDLGAEMIEGGKLTSKGLEELKSRMPFADLSSFSADPEVDKIADLYTVDMLVQY